ncbi:MAG: mechanosensitive ion channel [Pirellulales bacterium]|nr:mechanosensitive ion channel [Pirellulales bacterium]
MDAITLLFAQKSDTLLTPLQDALQKTMGQLADYIPNVTRFVIVLALGSLISWALSRLARFVGEKLELQTVMERSGLAESMREVGIKQTIPQILGLVVFWVFFVLTCLVAFNHILPQFDVTIQKILDYIPRLLFAVLLLVLGLLLAKFMHGLIATSADRLGLNYADTLANVCYFALVIVLLNSVITQLGIEIKLLENLILIAFTGLMLGLGLAVGLGGKDVIGGILAGYYVRQRLQSGDRVTVGDIQGIVREVGPVSTILDVGQGAAQQQRIIPNTKMLHEAVR